MRPDPKFTELQAVRPVPGAEVGGWKDGIIVTCEWEDAGPNPPGKPHGPRWVYEVQIDESDRGELYEIWVAEDDLRPR